METNQINTMEQSQQIEELIQYASTLYQNHVSHEEIKKALIRQGAEEELAVQIIQEIDKEEKKEKSSRGKYFLILGIILLGAGLINFLCGDQEMTRGTFRAYSKMTIGGGICILIGIVDWLSSKIRRE